MADPIRVAHITGRMRGGGLEQVVMNYYERIDRSRVQFDFLVEKGSPVVPVAEIRGLGGRVFEIPPVPDPIRCTACLEDLFREERWPIVHSHVNALSVITLRAAKRAGVPVRIAHSHSTAGRGRGELLRNASKAVLRRFSNVYPTHRMACSRYAGEWLFGKGADFEVVYNAIDLSRFTFDAKVRAEARADLDLVGDQLAVGHVGRFEPQKNHRFLIEAFAELVKHRPDAVLLLVGSGEAEALVKGWADERGVAGRVRFLGQRDDVGRLYQAFDAFALPSLYEGLGIVGVEAQAAGLPCFLSDRIPREVDVTGTVRFLPIDDVRVWAEVLAEVEPGARVDVHCEDFVDYDIDRAADKLTMRYLEMADKV